MKPLNAPIYELVEDILREQDVHDAARTSVASGNNGLFVVLAIILTVLHGFNLYLMLASGLWIAIPLLIHIVISGFTALIAYGQYKKGFNVQHFALMAIVSAVAGVFGTVGALVGFLLYVLFRQSTMHFNEWYESIFPTDHKTMPQQIFDDITEGIDENPKRYGVMPFIEVMRLGSETQKRRALSKMTTRFDPKLSPAFKIALKDKNNTIRVQAATAIAKIERDFMRILERIEEARAKEPRNTQLQLALAKFYDDYAFTGVLDPELELLNRDRAIAGYKAYLQADPNHADSWIAIGRLLFRSGKFDEASEWFRHAIDRGWKSRTLVLWYLECLFRTGQFKELRRAAAASGREILTNEELPQSIRDSVALWMRTA